MRKNKKIKIKPKEKKEAPKDDNNSLNSDNILFNFFKYFDHSKHQNKKKFSVKEKLKT